MHRAGVFSSAEAGFKMRTGNRLSPFALNTGAKMGYSPTSDIIGIYDNLNRPTGAHR